MNAERLLQHYERIADAPDAIARLRRFILDLAVRGKLVPQDANDETASELLRRIAEDKAQLCKAGAIRKFSEPEPVAEQEHPFNVPRSWEWVHLGDILTKLTDGTHHSPPNGPTGEFRYITAKNIKNEGVRLDDVTYVSRDVHNEIFARCDPAKGDILYIKDGATTGVVTVNDLEEPFSMLSSVALLKVPSCLFNRLIIEFLRSPFFYDQMRGFMKGAAITRVTLKRMGPALLPLPPLAEQHRIVAKIDELMALCDQVEASRMAREQARDRLAAASLVRLKAPDPETFEADARFALNALPALTTRPDQIKQLRQTILNLAVRGKLVPQDASDEPASELLKQIANEKARMVEAGEISRLAEIEPAVPGDLTFEIPALWKPAKIEQVLNELQTGPFGSSLHQSDYRAGGIPVINPASIQNDQIVPIEKMAVDELTLERLTSFKLRCGDIVMARRGEMGRCAVVGERETGWLCGTGSLILRPSKFIFADFLVLLIGSPFGRAYLAGSAVGTTMQNLNQSILLKLPFGLPPLAEQRRIVAKVDTLMALCDRLEASLTATAATRRLLLDAILAEALAPTDVQAFEAAE